MTEELLIRFLTRICTQEELLEVEKWISTDQANANWLFEMERVWSLKEELHYSDRKKIEAAYRRFVRAISWTRQKQSVIRQLHRGWMKYAAAIAVVFLLAANLYQAFRNKTSDEIADHTIEVPVGQRVANITLADGTKVWLNSGTTLKYPGVFTGSRREISIEGEGFFDVAHDHEKPFVVHAGEYDILAIGTQFNVEAYPESNDFSVSLLEGAVRVSSATDASQTITLQPNTTARLHDGRLVAEAITDLDHYRWRNGLISFNNMPFTTLMEKLEKWYGVKIVVENNHVENYALTGKFRQADGIDHVLRVLQYNFSFLYEWDDEHHVIYIK